MRKIIIGFSGATGVIYGIRLLEVLQNIPEVETHLIMSSWAEENIKIETNYLPKKVKELADFAYQPNDMSAPIASGSFKTEGMIILPCSVKTLSAISNGYANNLMSRAADVAIKENRKLIICPRETPLNSLHLENMLKLSRIGVNIIPPMPSFYSHPRTIDDIINHHIMKVLDQFEISVYDALRWEGVR